MNYTLLRKLADAGEENEQLTRRLYTKGRRGEEVTKQERDLLSLSNAQVKSLRRDVLSSLTHGALRVHEAKMSLIERFGEPIGMAHAGPGVPDERETCEECDGPMSPTGMCEICEGEMDEVAPPGWEGTVKAMKKHPEIDNPWALSWSMKNKGYKSHKKK